MITGEEYDQRESCDPPFRSQTGTRKVLVTPRAQLSRRPTESARPNNPDAVNATKLRLSDLSADDEREIDEFADDV